MIGILLGGLAIFVFGGMLLILLLGARGIENDLEKRAQEARQMRLEASLGPRFFLAAQPVDPGEVWVDEAVLGQVQRYLELEQTFADEFVLQPSIESLYRESGRSIVAH